ncbi:hypothetical protein Ciccas_008996 [Cichlidogyrus casuarinus]|uniref:C2 domain-containing protein n=1 Tax=Cichlidogyrus casuarinus TaxID=1844966 RepID=A0ABD2Q127_9PLAT
MTPPVVSNPDPNGVLKSPTVKGTDTLSAGHSHNHSHGHNHDSFGKSKEADSVKPQNSCGAIELTAHYCEDSNRLGIIVHQCKNLRGVDKDGLSDPYVKLRLKFDNGVSCGDKKKTQVVKNSVNPFFDDERFDFNADCRDLASLNLLVEVKNHVGIFQRTNSVTMLGKCTIPLDSENIKLGYRQWFVYSW